MAESEEELKSLLMKVKEQSEKDGSKLNIPKAKIMDAVLSLHSLMTEQQQNAHYLILRATLFPDI